MAGSLLSMLQVFSDFSSSWGRLHSAEFAQFSSAVHRLSCCAGCLGAEGMVSLALRVLRAYSSIQ